MNNTDKVLIYVVTLLISTICALLGYDIADRNMKEQAVLKGYGEWKCNPDGTHNTFHWKK